MGNSTPDNATEVINVMIGTAGHIDHGKTALVKLLTGCDTDTLAEEQKRGMTINLGFAPCVLGGDRKVGIVDVPGHEKFIRNMVAGVTGIDVVLLVVAADDGIMPQTIEHLHIIELLGVKYGLVAITKTDLVDEDMVELVAEDVRGFLKGTAFADAPVVPVSSVTGDGFDQFWKALNETIDKVELRAERGVFRVAVERAFSLKGHGTVATGIPISGRVSNGDTLELLPQKKKVRVRKMQVYNFDAETAICGQCVALNLGGIDHREIERGNVLATPGYFSTTSLVDARLTLLPSAPQVLKSQRLVRFHTGTSEIIGKVFLLDSKVLRPGETGLVQFRLNSEVVTAVGDSYILRLDTPMVTIGGGKVLTGDEIKLKPFREWALENLSQIESTIGKEEAFTEYVLRNARRDGLTPDEFSRKLALGPEESRVATGKLVKKRLAVLIGGKYYLHADFYNDQKDLFVETLKKLHADRPNTPNISRIALRDKTGISPALFDHLTAEFSSSGLVVADGDRLRHADHKVSFSAADLDLMDRVEMLYADAGYMPPNTDEVYSRLGVKKDAIGKVLNVLVDTGKLVDTAPGLFHHRDAIERAWAVVKQHFAANETLGIVDFRDAIGVSRKHAYPILEYFDRIGHTHRTGNIRYLKKKE